MFLKNPVIVRLGEYFFWRKHIPEYGTREAVMELDRAKGLIRYYKRIYRKLAYDIWLYDTKCLFACIVCGEDDPDGLNFHHLGEEYTGMQKVDSISTMMKKQWPLYRIEYEMTKCAVLCATCHQKITRGGKQALDDLYDMNERCYGYFFAPGEDWEKTKSNRREFRQNLKSIPIEIVASFEDEFLHKCRTTQEEEESIEESSYATKRKEVDWK